MSHHITIVDDDALPEGHDFVFVDLPAGAHIFYRRSTLGAESLEDSWAAYRILEQRRPPQTPTRIPPRRGQVVDLTLRAG